MKEKLKNEKERKINQKSHITPHTSHNSGITLVALIITIIVLLILAVVAIRAVQGDGILQYAKDAKTKTTVAQEKEQIQLGINEWQIQKNYQTTQSGSFKDFMEEKLSGVAEKVEGTDTLTVTMKDTGNIYTVKEDGTITGPKEIGNLSDLERYILGENGDGRPFGEIFGEGFIDDPNTIPDASTTVIMLSMANKDINTMVMYITYQEEKYKFAADTSTGNTIGEYGVAKLEKPAEESKVGKYVNYDGKIWIILYDDDINGLQMISAEALKYNGAEFNLGHSDSLIDWDSLTANLKSTSSWTAEQKKEVDFDGNGELNPFEKSVYSYNKAIETLNTACKSFVQQTDITSGKIIDVRCVGSNPADKDSENTTPYESENLSKWPIGSTAGIGNKKGKNTDYNYESDYERMIVLGLNNTSCWLASRFVYGDSSGVCFSMRCVDSSGYCRFSNLWSVDEFYAYENFDSELFRPVVSLKSDIQFTSGSGTAGSPYTF